MFYIGGTKSLVEDRKKKQEKDRKRRGLYKIGRQMPATSVQDKIFLLFIFIFFGVFGLGGGFYIIPGLPPILDIKDATTPKNHSP